MPRKSNIICYLKGRISREGNWYVSECLGLPVVTQGKTSSEAMGNLIEAVQLFIESCIDRGTLTKVLLKYGWKPSPIPFPPQKSERNTFSLPVPLPHIMQNHLEEWRV